MAPDVLVTHVARVATVTLNRPEAINAVDQSMRRKLIVAFDELARAPDVRVIISTSAGKRFAGGAGLKSAAVVIVRKGYEPRR